MDAVETWKFINSFAPWLAAIGTLAVAIVSLYIAFTPRPVRLKVSAGLRLILTEGQKGRPEFLVISATNIGHRAAVIDNIGWEFGFIRKRHAIQIPPNNRYSSQIPATVNDGATAKWFFPLDRRHDGSEWLDSFIKDFLLPHPRWNVRFIKVQLFTSIGKTFEVKLDQGMKKKILEKSRELSKKVS